MKQHNSVVLRVNWVNYTWWHLDRLQTTALSIVPINSRQYVLYTKCHSILFMWLVYNKSLYFTSSNICNITTDGCQSKSNIGKLALISPVKRKPNVFSAFLHCTVEKECAMTHSKVKCSLIYMLTEFTKQTPDFLKCHMELVDSSSPFLCLDDQNQSVVCQRRLDQSDWVCVTNIS